MTQRRSGGALRLPTFPTCKLFLLDRISHIASTIPLFKRSRCGTVEAAARVPAFMTLLDDKPAWTYTGFVTKTLNFLRDSRDGK